MSYNGWLGCRHGVTVLGFRKDSGVRAEDETLEFSFGVALGSFSVQNDGRYQQDALQRSQK